MPDRESETATAQYKYHVMQDARFVDMNLHQYGWEKCRPGHWFGPAIRKHFLFHYVISGRGRLDANNNTCSIGAGQGFMIFPDQITTYYADEDDPWEYAWLEFSGLHAREQLTLAGLSEKSPVYTPADKKSGEDLKSLIMYLVDHPNISPLRLVGNTMIILDQLVQSSVTRLPTSNKRLREFYLNEAISLIDNNYHRDLSVEEMAAACGLNRSYFGRIFKDSMGVSPQQFLMNYRMAKAAELLKNSRLPILQISASVGYPDQLNFSRAFKHVYGIPPREYRSKYFVEDRDKTDAQS